VQGGKLPFSTSPQMAEHVIQLVRNATKKPIFAKLSPNVSDIAEIARAVEAGGADGITAVNTLLGMRVDWRTGKPALNTIQGGYSGLGVKPVALRCAWACARAVKIPIIGCGGISGPEDALEFLVAGCRAVQFGTASFTDPSRIAHLANEMSSLLDRHGFSSVTDVIGTLRVPGQTAAAPGAPS
jgi:dihydroorotate dehydrogenase (NAD+) catalytic subunit